MIYAFRYFSIKRAMEFDFEVFLDTLRLLNSVSISSK